MTDSQPADADSPSPAVDEDEDLTLEAIDDVAGPITIGRTAEIKLDDGRVVVARITQVQDGELECRHDECFRRFDSKRARETHIGKFHPELRDRECVGCGETFSPPSAHRKQKYCSQECYLSNRRDSETLICEECGATFEVKPSHADDRKHCSNECQYESLKGPKEDNTREERECPECGDTFETYPSESVTHCSKACADSSRWETRTCPMCSDDFDVRKAREKVYCGRPCFYEDCRADDRPDGYFKLLEELQDEFDDPGDVVARARAHLAPDIDGIQLQLLRQLADETTADYQQAVTAVYVDLDAEYSKPELERFLLDAVADDPDLPVHLEGSDLERALADETLHEVSDRLRVQRKTADAIVKRLGVRDRFASAAELVDQLAADGGDSQ